MIWFLTVSLENHTMIFHENEIEYIVCKIMAIWFRSQCYSMFVGNYPIMQRTFPVAPEELFGGQQLWRDLTPSAFIAIRFHSGF